MADKKLALITGANWGLGLETARQFARLGHPVMLTSRNESERQAAVEALGAEGLVVEYQRLDVSGSATIEAVRDLISNKYGNLHILVNNAGIYIDRGSPALQVDESIVQQTFDVNFLRSAADLPGLHPLDSGWRIRSGG